jgi:hypothetical protein
MCFISPATNLQRISIAKKEQTQPEKILKQQKLTQDYDNVKVLKRIFNKFDQNRIERPAFVKVTFDNFGKKCEFGEDSFKKIENKFTRTVPTFSKKSNSLGLFLNVDSVSKVAPQNNLIFEESLLEPSDTLFNYDNLFDGKEISDLLSSLEERRINIDF